jgi:hypothetical protein
LRERERQGRATLDVLPDEAIGEHADVDRGVGGILDDRGPMFLRQREEAEDLADTMGRR